MNTRRSTWILRTAVVGLFVCGGQLAQAYDCYGTTTYHSVGISVAVANCNDGAYGQSVTAEAGTTGNFATATAWADNNWATLTLTASSAAEDDYDDEYYDESYNAFEEVYWNDGGGSWSSGDYYCWASS